jgi:hypothetical protein
MRPVPDGRKAYLLIVGDGKERVPVQLRLEEAGEKDGRSWVSKTSHSV